MSRLLTLILLVVFLAGCSRPPYVTGTVVAVRGEQPLIVSLRIREGNKVVVVSVSGRTAPAWSEVIRVGMTISIGLDSRWDCDKTLFVCAVRDPIIVLPEPLN